MIKMTIYWVNETFSVETKRFPTKNNAYDALPKMLKNNIIHNFFEACKDKASRS
jgi:hypothetical protein